MRSSKLVLTASAAVFGVFGAGWLIVPERLYRYWGIVPDTNQYMGRRYGAFMLGLMVISWLMRGAPNTQPRRAILVGSLVCWVLTDALSLYGALALGLNAWWPFVVEFVLVIGFAWVLFVRSEASV
jgi:hypothetical protein